MAHVNVHDLLKTQEIGKFSQKELQDQGYIRLRRGIYVPESCFPVKGEPWNYRHFATLVRAASAVVASQGGAGSIVFTSEVGLKLLGYDTWTNTPDIMLRRYGAATYRPRQQLPAIAVKGIHVPRVGEIQLRSAAPTDKFIRAGGLQIAPGWVAALDCARDLHPMVGLCAVSLFLNGYSSFDRWSQRGPRIKAAKLKGVMLDSLDQMKGYPGTRRAREIIQAADPGIEKPGEGYLWWLLRCLLTHSPSDLAQLVTQFRIEVDGKTYFPDAALPHRKLLFEFDGEGKIRGNEAKFLERQSDLLSAGYQVVRVSSKDLNAPQQLIAKLTREMRRQGVPASPPSGSLWSPLPEEVLDPKRRH